MRKLHSQPRSKRYLARPRQILALAALGTMPGLSALPALGGTTNSTWISGDSSSWSNAADWTPSGAPNNSGPNLYNVTISGGTVTLDISPTIQQLDLSGGTFTGASTTLTLDDVFTWSGGTLGASGGSQTINADGGMSVSGNTVFSGGTLNNNATATWSAGYIQAYGGNATGKNTLFNNNLAANFNIQCDAIYYGYGSSYTAPDQFNNYGTLTKSTTTGTTDIYAEFNNSGTVNVQTGTLELGGGGTQTGSFALSSGATLQINANATFQSGSSISGMGNINVSGGTVAFSAANVSISTALTVSGGTATFTTGTANINPSSITLSGGSLTGSDTITTAGLFTWSGGTVGASGSSEILNADGGISIGGGTSFSGGTINNNATATWSGGAIDAYGGDAANMNTLFNNNLAANFNIQCDEPYYGYGLQYTVADQFNNYGTLTKSTTTGTTDISAEFDNSGTVNVQTGTLELGGGGTQTGSFALSSGATLQIAGNTSFQSASSVSGMGNVIVSAGTSTVQGTYDPSGATTVSGGAVTISSSNVSISGALTVSGGTATFTTGTANINPSSITLSSGSLTGSDTITTAGLFTWSGGTVGASASSETLNANGGISISGGASFSGGTINNNATATWSGGAIDAYGGDAANMNTLFNNNLAANFNIQCDELYYGYGSGNTAPDQFNNYGTLTKSTTTGTTDIYAEFNNSGTVNVQTGTLELGGGGTQTGGFALSSGATLQIASSTTFQSASSISGMGNVIVSGGTSTIQGTYHPSGATTVSGGAVTFSSSNVSISTALTVSGGTATFTTGTANINPSSITLSSGSLTGSDTITTAGLFTWSGGTVGASGSSEILNADGGISIGGGTSFSGGTINNNATATWSGGAIDAYGGDAANMNTLFNNNLAANFNIQCDEPYYGYGLQYTVADQFNNYGTLTKSTTTGTTDISAEFDNSGTVNVQTGTLELGGGGTQTGSFALSSGATLQIAGNTSFQSASSVSGMGNVIVSAGTSTVQGTYDPSGATTVSGGAVTISSSNVSISGALTVSGGTATFTTGTANINPSSITLSSGSLTGSDTITTAGLFTWSGGTVGASGSSQTLNANGGIAITGGDVYFAGGTLNNNATTTTWSGGSIYAYGGNAANMNTIFNNNLAANFNIQCDEPYYGYGSQFTVPDQFNNYGTLTKSTTTGTTYIYAEFNNSGTVNVQTGTLELVGGGTQTGSFALSSGATLQIDSSTTFQSASSIRGMGNVTVTAGTLTMNGANTYSGGSTVTSGTLIANSANALPNGGNLANNDNVIVNANNTVGNVSGSGTTTVNSTGSLTTNNFTQTALVNNGTTTINGTGAIGTGGVTGSGTLNIGNGSSSNVVTLAQGSVEGTQTAINVASGSTLDITNNRIILTPTAGTQATELAYYLSLVKHGYNSGSWTGTGITSSAVAAANKTSPLYGIAVAEDDGSYGTVTGLANGQIEIAEAVIGDATLSGTVNFADFVKVEGNYGLTGADWDEGDFFYTGTVNFADFVAVEANFGDTNAISAPEMAAMQSFAGTFGDTLVANSDGVGFQVVSVPEPASAGLLALAGIGLLAHRRRRAN